MSDFEDEDTVEIVRASAFDNELQLESREDWFWSDADCADGAADAASVDSTGAWT
jgi:hypothetical protein